MCNVELVTDVKIEDLRFSRLIECFGKKVCLDKYLQIMRDRMFSSLSEFQISFKKQGYCLNWCCIKPV